MEQAKPNPAPAVTVVDEELRADPAPDHGKSILITTEQEDLMLDRGSLPTTLIRDPIVWRERGPEEDRRAQLRAVFQIGSFYMHVTAYGIHLEDTADWDDEAQRYRQYPMDNAEVAMRATARVEFDQHVETTTEIGEILSALGMDGSLEPFIVEGRHYLIVACPYCK